MCGGHVVWHVTALGKWAPNGSGHLMVNKFTSSHIFPTHLSHLPPTSSLTSFVPHFLPPPPSLSCHISSLPHPPSLSCHISSLLPPPLLPSSLTSSHLSCTSSHLLLHFPPSYFLPSPPSHFLLSPPSHFLPSPPSHFLPSPPSHFLTPSLTSFPPPRSHTHRCVPSHHQASEYGGRIR